MNHHFDHDTKQLLMFKSLRIFEMNETAAYFYRLYMQNASVTAAKSAAKVVYDIDDTAALADATEMYSWFDELELRATSGCETAPWVGLNTPIIHIIQNCNSPCRMCECWKTKGAVHHPLAKLRPLFEKLVELGASSVMISGGEPLLHPEIREILLCLKELKLPIMLNTNGLLLGRRLDLAELGIEEIVMSMDGYDRDTYRATRGSNADDVIWANIAKFRELSPATRIGLRVTISKWNYRHLDKIVARAREHGLYHIGFSPADVTSESFSRKDMTSAKSAAMAKAMLPDQAEIAAFLGSFQPGDTYHDFLDAQNVDDFISWGPLDIRRCLEFYAGTMKGSEDLFSSKSCLFPRSSFLLDYDGALRSCFYSEPFGHLDRFDEVEWALAPRLRRLEETSRCSNCRGKIFCDTVKVNGGVQA